MRGNYHACITRRDALSGEKKIALRSQISQVLQRASVPPSNLPQDELRALHDLRKDKDRLIIQADKGNCTFVMDRKDYDEKVQLNQVQSSLLSYVRHGCPVARARGSCLKRKTIKLTMSKTI